MLQEHAAYRSRPHADASLPVVAVVVVTVVSCGCWVTDGSEPADLMEKDDLVHDMESVSPRSHEDNLPVSQQRILKFELQLYKKDSHYLLDVQVSSP